MIRAETLRDGAVERLVLARPKANVLDAAMLGAIREHLRALQARPELKLLVFDSEGDHFSFGASVEEHLPDRVGGMLASFDAMFHELEAVGAPTAAVVRGQCLGGGMELAIACGRIFCSDSARFAVPEVTLGVFPPVAALLLPFRTGLGPATRMVLGGKPVRAEEAVRIGLADALAPDPAAAALAWYDEELAPLSAVAVRHAWRALRIPIIRALEADLYNLERLYLGSLMSHRDPVEGLEAFLARRPPVWTHR